MNVDAQQVIDRLARHIADLTVRLAVAESQVEAYKKAEVDRLAEQEADHD